MSQFETSKLGEPYDGFVSEQIENGRFEDPDDVIRAGLELLKKQERKRETLRKALQEGLDSGEAREFDFDELFDDAEFDMVTGKRLSV